MLKTIVPIIVWLVLIRSGQFKITLVAELGIQPLLRSFWTETSAITFSTFSIAVTVFLRPPTVATGACVLMAPASLCFQRNAQDYEESRQGMTVFAGHAASFHEWQFRLQIKKSLCKAEELPALTAKVVDALDLVLGLLTLNVHVHLSDFVGLLDDAIESILDPTETGTARNTGSTSQPPQLLAVQTLVMAVDADGNEIGQRCDQSLDPPFDPCQGQSGSPSVFLREQQVTSSDSLRGQSAVPRVSAQQIDSYDEETAFFCCRIFCH